MLINEDYRPRFSFEVTEEQKLRADRLITQYGLRKALFQHILDDVLDLIEERGGIAIGILMSGAVKPREILPTMHAADKEGRKDG